MTKNYILFLFFLFAIFHSQTGSVGINTDSPHTSSVLDVHSDSKGLLIPRLTSQAVNSLSASASEGIIVFDKDKKLFLGWDGTKWQILGNVVISNQQSFAAWEVSSYTNYGSSPANASSYSLTGVSSATLSRGSGMTAPASGAAGATWGGSGWNQSTLANAISNNQFAIVTINFISGKTASFTKINANNLRTTGTGPTTSQYQYSIDNGTTFTNIGNPITLTSTGTSGNNIADIDLSVYYDLQNINTSTITNVKFRIVSYGGTSGSGNWYINNLTTGNDLEFTGTIQ